MFSLLLLLYPYLQTIICVTICILLYLFVIIAYFISRLKFRFELIKLLKYLFIHVLLDFLN